MTHELRSQGAHARVSVSSAACGTCVVGQGSTAHRRRAGKMQDGRTHTARGACCPGPNAWAWTCTVHLRPLELVRASRCRLDVRSVAALALRVQEAEPRPVPLQTRACCCTCTARAGCAGVVPPTPGRSQTTQTANGASLAGAGLPQCGHVHSLGRNDRAAADARAKCLGCRLGLCFGVAQAKPPGQESVRRARGDREACGMCAGVGQEVSGMDADHDGFRTRCWPWERRRQHTRTAPTCQSLLTTEATVQPADRFVAHAGTRVSCASLQRVDSRCAAQARGVRVGERGSAWPHGNAPTRNRTCTCTCLKSSRHALPNSVCTQATSAQHSCTTS